MKVGIKVDISHFAIYGDNFYDKRSIPEMKELFGLFIHDKGYDSEFRSAMAFFRDDTPEHYLERNIDDVQNIVNSMNWNDVYDQGYSIDMQEMHDEWNDITWYGSMNDRDLVYELKKGGVPSHNVMIGNTYRIGGVA